MIQTRLAEMADNQSQQSTESSLPGRYDEDPNKIKEIHIHYYYYWLLEARSHSVAQVDLELMVILLPQPLNTGITEMSHHTCNMYFLGPSHFKGT